MSIFQDHEEQFEDFPSDDEAPPQFDHTDDPAFLDSGALAALEEDDEFGEFGAIDCSFERKSGKAGMMIFVGRFRNFKTLS